MRVIWFLLMLMTAGAAAADNRISFTPLDDAIVNPGRGFWVSPTDDFARLAPDDLTGLRERGISLIYGVVRLDGYRRKRLPDRVIARIDKAFALARGAGVKVILRFAYNYPESEHDYRSAKDAPLARVLGHIAQLGPVIVRNRDVIMMLQAGFIGAWGEGHSSSNGLDSPAAKRAVIAALIAATPPDLAIQWRYPADLMGWIADGLPGHTRIGLHNDCFLSSPTDVGTYSEDSESRAKERRAAQAITARVFYSGETCAAEPGGIRADCSSILAEGAAFHVQSLNRDYYEAFHRTWERQGCFDAVERALGYRLRLIEVERGEDGLIALEVVNEGWARPAEARQLVLHALEANGAARAYPLGPGDARDFLPGQPLRLVARIAGRAQRFCVAAADRHSTLTANPRYAIRFANADNPARMQKWDAERGRFCFDFPP